MNIMKFCLASGTAAALLVGTFPAMAYTGQELANLAQPPCPCCFRLRTAALILPILL
jgi:hypothetical protein